MDRPLAEGRIDPILAHKPPDIRPCDCQPWNYAKRCSGVRYGERNLARSREGGFETKEGSNGLGKMWDREIIRTIACLAREGSFKNRSYVGVIAKEENRIVQTCLAQFICVIIIIIIITKDFGNSAKRMINPDFLKIIYKLGDSLFSLMA